MQNKTYTIGDATRRYLDALDAFAKFTNTFYDALTDEYGEKAGDEMYQTHVAQFEDVERTVMDYMRVQLTQEMGGDRTEITI